MICSPFIFFKKNNANTLLVKILDDTRQIGQYIALYYFIYFSNTLRFLINFAFLAALDKVLALLVLISLPLYYICASRSFKKLEHYSNKEREKFDILSNSIINKLSNIKTIKSFGKEDMFSKHFEIELDDWYKEERKIKIWQEINMIVKNFISKAKTTDSYAI
ncbi:MAG: hypothetical protein ATN35_08200 [Epulopiscium sp. Nele67-Bin004]|nr:MAG: hypothetical protein ATN35_08200 [Epulopiscium sp. Nele67-Bin004]